MDLVSAISNDDIGKAIDVLSALGLCISELRDVIITERRKVESCAYDLIRRAHKDDDLEAGGRSQ